MKRIAIVLFAAAFHPHVGGVEEICRQLSLDYRRREMSVAAVTNRWPRYLQSHKLVGEITLH